MRVHYTDNYLLNPQHKITVNLIGLGGTGSQVLSALSRMDQALVALGHPGLHVYGWDPDFVSEANIGRQLFSAADIGINKAVCLITRVNRFYGYNWEARPEEYHPACTANITISCIDSAAGRILLAKDMGNASSTGEPFKHPIYWLDFGNNQKTGQVVLGTLHGKLAKKHRRDYTVIETDKTTVQVKELPHVVKLLPRLKKVKEEDNGPSCSLAEALGKQDLFINSTLSNLGMAILWKLFREGMITHHGCYLNLETMSVNPIRV